MKGVFTVRITNAISSQIFPQRTCTGGLQYLSCTCMSVSYHSSGDIARFDANTVALMKRFQQRWSSICVVAVHYAVYFKRTRSRVLNP